MTLIKRGSVSNAKMWIPPANRKTVFSSFRRLFSIPATSPFKLSVESLLAPLIRHLQRQLETFPSELVECPRKHCFETLKLSDRRIMEISFHGKRALVTGAGKGIGRALTLKLAECGAEVVAVSRTQSDLESLKEESPKIQTLCLDISNWDLTKNALKSIGSIDLLVNNAGVLEIIEYGAYTEQDYD
ncbi:L-xylulose reductase, partial [Araneus ventricosus]